MGALFLDLRVALRRLRHIVGFTAAAVITLALGIGANTTIFTAINALVFRALPVDRPGELVAFNTRTTKVEYPVQSLPNYRDFRDRNDVFSGLIIYAPVQVTFSRGGGKNALVWGYVVSGNYFDLLGVGASLGRVLHAEDDRNRLGHPLAVISYGCWQRRFGGDPEVAGKTIKLNGLDYRIAGVAPAGFFGTEIVYIPDFWVPMAMQPQIAPGNDSLGDRRNFSFFVIGIEARRDPGARGGRSELDCGATRA